MESFGWGVPVEGFSGACVEFFGDQGELVWRELSKVFAFGEVLTQEAVGVLVRAALPGRSGSQKYTSILVATVKVLCSAISEPWSHVRVRRNCSGRGLRHR